MSKFLSQWIDAYDFSRSFRIIGEKESVIFFGMKVLCFSKHAVNFSMQPIRFIRSNFPRVIENYDH